MSRRLAVRRIGETAEVRRDGAMAREAQKSFSNPLTGFRF